MQKISKKDPVLSSGCDGSLEFDEYVSGLYEEGDVTKYGQQALFSNDPLFDMDGDIVGAASGLCTVIAEADTSGSSPVQLCNTYYKWTSGPFENSTMVTEGTYTPDDASNLNTIVGGAGCFAGATGMVETKYDEDTNNYHTVIQLDG